MSTAPSLTLTVRIASAIRTIIVDGPRATIGRGADCTLVLADTRRAISRLQASIEWRNGHYVLTDSGSNPTLVNGHILNVSREAVLRDADTLSIGDYLIELGIGGTSASDDATVFAALPAGSSRGGQAAEIAPADAFDDLTMVRLPSSRRGALPESSKTTMPGAAPASAASAPVLSAVPTEGPPVAPLTALPVDLPPTLPAAAAMASASQDTVGHASLSEPMLSALCDGLGVEYTSLAACNAPELARRVGMLLREAIEGSITALHACPPANEEALLAMTATAASTRNPLRHAPNAEAALLDLLCANENPGSLAPPAVLRETFGDLHSYQLALRNALRTSVAALSPERIEARHPGSGSLRDLLSRRPARLWAHYIETWQQAARRADELLNAPAADHTSSRGIAISIAPTQQSPNTAQEA